MFRLIDRLLLAGLLSVLLLACQAAPSTPLPHAAATKTGVSGTVLDQRGQPLSGSYVYAYRNQQGGLRGPADFEAAVDARGHYWLDLVGGRYYLIARWRQGGLEAGPPRPGDAWALPAGNPVVVPADGLVRVDFILQQVAQPMLMREGTLAGGDTGFTGRLIDATGQPVAGAFVVAYPDTDYRRMPEATSPAVGTDGRFSLYVSRPGQWCLAARTRTRGQLAQGELYGLLEAGDDGCRVLEAGEIIDIGAITLTPYRR